MAEKTMKMFGKLQSGATVYLLPSYVTHLAECRGAALGDLGLQRANKLAELDAVVELLHEELGSDLLICSGEAC